MGFLKRSSIVFSALLAAALVFADARAPLHAHILPDTITLSQRVSSADLVVRARITDPNIIVNSDNTTKTSQQLVGARVLETLRGKPAQQQIRFIPHRHNDGGYEKGDELILFLKAVKQAGPAEPAAPWISIDDFADRISLDAANTEAVLSAVRAYTDAFAQPEPEAREAFRRATLSLLQSEQPRVAAFALRDLLLSQGPSLIHPEDIPALEALIENTKYSIALRTALLAELERKHLLDTAPHWLKLLQSTPPANIATVTKSLPKPLRPELRRELDRLLSGPSPDAIKAAAAALGTPGDDTALDALGRALASASDPGVRQALVESIGKMASPSAQLKLKEIASTHEDQNLRRSAQTELNLLQLHAKGQSADAGIAPPQPSQDTQSIPSNEIPSLSQNTRLYWIVSALVFAALLIFAFYRRRRPNSPP